MKLKDQKCIVSAEYLYSLLMEEAEFSALIEGDVASWKNYCKALNDYASAETLKRQYGPVFDAIPPSAVDNFQAYAAWESEEILKDYLV